MRKGMATTALVASAFTALTLVSFEAAACGESLFRIGKGMSYRVPTAPLPGNVIVVTETDAHRRFAERLAEAGHSVRTVGSAAELAAMLTQDEADVVIARFSDRDVVADQFASVDTDAQYLPVTVEKSEETLAKELYRRPLAESDSFSDFMRAIHRVLKS